MFCLFSRKICSCFFLILLSQFFVGNLLWANYFKENWSKWMSFDTKWVSFGGLFCFTLEKKKKKWIWGFYDWSIWRSRFIIVIGKFGFLIQNQKEFLVIFPFFKCHSCFTLKNNNHWEFYLWTIWNDWILPRMELLPVHLVYFLQFLHF